MISNFLFIEAVFSQCVSRTINFAGASDLGSLGFTAPYGSENARLTQNGLELFLVKSSNPNEPAKGCEVESTFSMRHGRISIRMNAINEPGAVTAFNTMSPRKDEIDVEFVGKRPTAFESNIFYKGIPEYGIRGGVHQVGPIDRTRLYEIDWTPTDITWLVDSRAVRTYSKNSDLAVTSQTPPGERSFPDEASKLYFSLWDGGDSPDSGTSDWAGGKINWGGRTELSMTVQSISIQCYDNNPPGSAFARIGSQLDLSSASAMPQLLTMVMIIATIALL